MNKVEICGVNTSKLRLKTGDRRLFAPLSGR